MNTSRSGRRVSARDVVGVPVLPPAAMTGIATRARAAIARLHRTMAPPPLRILESLFGLLDHAALVALCALEVPDHLDRPVPVGVLASRTGADADALDRLIRYASMRGWVHVDRRGRVAPTATSRFLARSHPGGWRAWVEFLSGDDVIAAARALAVAVRAGGDAFSTANDASFFDWMAAHPQRNAAFDDAMGAGARLHALALAKALDWSDDLVVCDVGGGDGSLLDALVAMHSHLSGVLFDLPGVVERASASVSARIAVVAGDAFEEVPAGASTYLLVNVVHDWSDADAIRLLRRVATDAPESARVVVVEGVRRVVPLDDVTHRTDLLMLLFAPGGRERTIDEVARLAETAGLVQEKAVPLASGDVAHVLRRARPRPPISATKER